MLPYCFTFADAHYIARINTMHYIVHLTYVTLLPVLLFYKYTVDNGLQYCYKDQLAIKVAQSYVRTYLMVTTQG